MVVYPKAVVQLRMALRKVLRKLLQGWLRVRPFEFWESWPTCRECEANLEIAQSGGATWYLYCPECTKGLEGSDEYYNYLGSFHVYEPWPKPEPEPVSYTFYLSKDTGPEAEELRRKIRELARQQEEPVAFVQRVANLAQDVQPNVDRGNVLASADLSTLQHIWAEVGT